MAEHTRLSQWSGVLLHPRATFQKLVAHPDLIGAALTVLGFTFLNAIMYVARTIPYFTVLGPYGMVIQLVTTRELLLRAITSGPLVLAGWALISLLLAKGYDLPSWKTLASPLGYAFLGGLLVALLEGLTLPFHPHLLLSGPTEWDLHQQLTSYGPLILHWLLITLTFRILINLAIALLGSYGFSYAVKGTLSRPATFLRLFLFLTTFSFLHVLFFPPIEILVYFATIN